MNTYVFKQKEIGKNKLVFPIVAMSSADVKAVQIGKQKLQQ